MISQVFYWKYWKINFYFIKMEQRRKRMWKEKIRKLWYSRVRLKQGNVEHLKKYFSLGNQSIMLSHMSRVSLTSQRLYYLWYKYGFLSHSIFKEIGWRITIRSYFLLNRQISNHIIFKKNQILKIWSVGNFPTFPM